MYFVTKEKKECCGCSACGQVCPKNAISFVPVDNEGFKYPVIDEDKCIHCHLCEKICPVENPVYSNDEHPTVYATYLNDEDERGKSSSGGIFFAIASWIIMRGGKVYGAAFNEDFQLSHQGVSSISELDKLRGSKYVQSDLKDSFKCVKKDLETGQWVYFVGTPCQVAGLNNFLKKKYHTLITSDLVCHGVPSQQLFNQHIAYLEGKHKGKIIDYAFRDNKGWGVCEIFKFRKPGKTKVREKRLPSYVLSPYLYSFMYSYTYRYSCYDCKFARIPRQGDITLADYWNVKNFFSNIDTSKGVSMIMINTQKGKDIWKQIKDNCVWEESNVKDAATYNRNVNHVSEMPSIRETIYDDIEKIGYKRIAETKFRGKDYHKKRIRFIIKDSKWYNYLREKWYNNKKL